MKDEHQIGVASERHFALFNFMQRCRRRAKLPGAPALSSHHSVSEEKGLAARDDENSYLLLDTANLKWRDSFTTSEILFNVDYKAYENEYRAFHQA